MLRLVFIAFREVCCQNFYEKNYMNCLFGLVVGLVGHGFFSQLEDGGREVI